MMLAVDDDPIALQILGTLAESEGFEFRGYPDGSSGMAALRDLNPDVVCLDVQLPGASGFELCNRIKSDTKTRLLPVLLITSLGDRQSKVKGIEAGCDDFLAKPFDRNELAARVKMLARTYRLNRDLEESERVVQSLALSVEARDPTTGGHCERVAGLAAELGELLGLSGRQVAALRKAGLLHDVGKIGIPDSILLNPGELSEPQWEVMRRHPAIGEAIVRPLSSLRGVLPIIRHHHERWDGTGYPDGLRGQQIPLAARVFQIVDAFDALTSERPYRQALSRGEAVRCLVLECGHGRWDREIMTVFAENVLRA